MGILSLRRALNTVGVSQCAGLRALHPFYISNPGEFPFRSIRSLIKHLEWPRGFGFAEPHDYPSNREPGWSEELQGVTHDQHHWYFSQRDVLWRFPVSHDINEKPGLNYAIPIDEVMASPPPSWLGLTISGRLRQLGYNHMGDCDFYGDDSGGMLLVPIEGGNPPLVETILVSNTGMLTGPEILLTGQSSAPWCAMNKLTGELYSSEFEIDANGLTVYKKSRNGWQFAGRFPLYDQHGNPRVIHRVQGGVFSMRGHLYLVSDDGTGILGFDMLTGRQVRQIGVVYQPTTTIPGYGTVIKEELEGITIWDLDGGPAPNISGQIHLVMIDNYGSGADDLYFKHFRVTYPEDKNMI